MATRTLTVPAKDAGQNLVAWLRARLALPEGEVRRLVRERKVRVGGNPCSHADWSVRAGQRVEVELPARKEPAGGPVPVIRHVDEHLVLVDKPSGLTTMRHAEDVREFGARAKRYLPPTLQDLLPG